MKVTRAQAREHRQRILDVASRTFRSKGFDGASVADIMAAAGMTHGGFYGHFDSKVDLQAEACSAALASATARWAAVIADSPEDALESIVDGYLSERHRDSPAIGCAFAALAAEASRGESAVRGAFTNDLNERVDLLSRVAPGSSPGARRAKAIATIAALVGAIVLARVVDDADLSDEILEAARKELG